MKKFLFNLSLVKVLFFMFCVVCCGVTLFAQSNYASKCNVLSDSENALFMPFAGESVAFVEVATGEKECYVKVYSYDGVPYSGRAWKGEDAVDSVTYWNHEELRHGREKIGKDMRFSTLVWVLDSTISVKSRTPIDMYVINALTGDTVLSNHFPKPKMRTDVIRMKKGISERHKEIMQKRGGYAFSGDSVSVEMIDEVLHYDYSLPQGLYFAYFVDVEDRVLCWAEKINKK